MSSKFVDRYYILYDIIGQEYFLMQFELNISRKDVFCKKYNVLKRKLGGFILITR